MRTLVELPNDQVEALDRMSAEDRRACEAVIQAAVADYLEEDRKRRWALIEAGFGIWKNRGIDGLEYQRRIRSEWDGRVEAWGASKLGAGEASRPGGQDAPNGGT